MGPTVNDIGDVSNVKGGENFTWRMSFWPEINVHVGLWPVKLERQVGKIVPLVSFTLRVSSN
jgi:hypothetical protein